LIRKDQVRLQLRSLLLAGAASNSAALADAHYFDGLRDRVSSQRPWLPGRRSLRSPGMGGILGP
jgi:antitoxin ParD1/3/4